MNKGLLLVVTASIVCWTLYIWTWVSLVHVGTLSTGHAISFAVTGVFFALFCVLLTAFHSSVTLDQHWQPVTGKDADKLARLRAREYFRHAHCR